MYQIDDVLLNGFLRKLAAEGVPPEQSTAAEPSAPAATDAKPVATPLLYILTYNRKMLNTGNNQFSEMSYKPEALNTRTKEELERSTFDGGRTNFRWNKLYLVFSTPNGVGLYYAQISDNNTPLTKAALSKGTGFNSPAEIETLDFFPKSFSGTWYASLQAPTMFVQVSKPDGSELQMPSDVEILASLAPNGQDGKPEFNSTPQILVGKISHLFHNKPETLDKFKETLDSSRVAKGETLYHVDGTPDMEASKIVNAKLEGKDQKTGAPAPAGADPSAPSSGKPVFSPIGEGANQQPIQKEALSTGSNIVTGTPDDMIAKGRALKNLGKNTAIRSVTGDKPAKDVSKAGDALVQTGTAVKRHTTRLAGEDANVSIARILLLASQQD